MAYAYFNPDKTELSAVAIKNNGNISAIARHFNVSAETVYQYIRRDPIGKEIIDFVRGLNTENDLDLAEHVIRYNMANYKANAGLAQRAAEKVIDKKGQLRGWVDNTNANPPNTSELKTFIQELKSNANERKAEEILQRSHEEI